MRFNRNTAAAHAFAALALVALALVGCGGGGGTGPVTPPSIAPSATPSPAGTATPPVWPSPVAFDVQDTTMLTPSTRLPSGGGFAGTFSTQAVAYQYTQVTAELTNAAPSSGIGPLQVARRPQDVLPNQTLAYIGLTFTLAVPAAPLTISMQMPQSAVLSGASYYLAMWDPLRPSLGWQHAFAGPVQPDTSSGVPKLTFIANAPQLNRYVQYWFAIYMLPSSAATPTPAPSISPIVTPSPVPTKFSELQRLMSKTYSCSGTPCATGKIPSPQPTQEYDVLPDQISPVVLPGGHSTLLQFHIHSGEDGDVLYQTPSLIADATPQQVQQAALATNFIFDFYVWVGEPVWDANTNSPLRLSALEFDFNDASPGVPGFDYNFSSQCLMHDAQHGGPQWQIWGQKGDTSNWVDSGIACDPATTFAPDMWHHIAWTYRLHPDTLQTEYVSLEIDGATYYPPFALNPIVPLPVQAKATLEVQFQQDARALPAPTPPAPTPSPFKEWVDEVTLTAW